MANTLTEAHNVDTLDNTQAHCAQLHTNDRHRAEAYADRMQSLGYRVTTSSDYSPTKRGTVYTVTVAKQLPFVG